MNISNLFLRPSDTILDAVRKMDSEHIGLVLIVNESGRLVGVLVDADVRRALIAGKDLELHVEEVMTRDFVSVRSGADDSEIIRLLQSPVFQTRTPVLIPALDEDRRPVALYNADELMNRRGANLPESETVPRKEKVLVIGGAGYVGSVLVRKLLESGHKVTVLDRLLYGDSSIRDLFGHPRFEFKHGDTRHIDELVPVIHKASSVVHLAELVGDPACADDPQTTFEINYLATASIAQICSYLQINRFIYLSSCSVYGATSDRDQLSTEQSELAPLSLYAKMKLNSERLILGTAGGNFSPCILRLGTVFGMSYRPRFDLVVNRLAAQALQDGQIRIFGGRQWRPHVHVSDVGDAIKLALEAPLEEIRNQIFNIVGENKTIADLGGQVTQLVEGTTLLTEDTAVDERNYRVSGDRAGEVLGFHATKTIGDGIVEIVEAVKDGRIQHYRDKRYHNVSL